MPDEFGNYTDEELGLNSDVVESLDPNLRDEIRKSRSRLAEAHKWQARAESAERQIAVRDVGIDTSTKLGQMFMKSYEGEWTAEAIAAEAQQIPGLLPEPQGTGNEGPTPEELEAQRRMAGAGAAQSSGGPDVQSKFDADIRAASSAEEVMRLIDQADPALGVYRKGLA